MIKGYLDMIGVEEILEDSEFREFSCKCVSQTAELYSISKEVNPRQDFLSRLVNFENHTLLDDIKRLSYQMYRKRFADFKGISTNRPDDNSNQ